MRKDQPTTLVDNHAHILVKSLPNCQELVHITVHKCIPIQAGS